MWYAFYGQPLESEDAFEAAVDAVAKELGEHGRSRALAAPPLPPTPPRPAVSASPPAPARPAVVMPAAPGGAASIAPQARHRAVATAADLQVVEGRLTALGAAGLLTAAELDALDDLVGVRHGPQFPIACHR